MNEKKIQKQLEKLKGVTLSDGSRARMRDALSEYADFHGAPEGVRAAGEGRSIGHAPAASPVAYRLFGINIRTFTMHATAAILITVMLGGGTSYAAESAVPGDALYPVKVAVNERVQSAFAVSNAAEARLQAELAKERLEEAETLAARGTLDADASAALRNRIEAHYNEALERSDRAEAAGDIETAARVRGSLEGTFRSYADILSRIDASVGGSGSADIVNDIRAYANTAANAQATATVNAGANADADISSTVDRAGSIVAEVRSRLDRAQSDLSADASARIAARLDEAAAAEAEARASLEQNLRHEAYQAAQAAIRIASEARAMIESALRLDVELDLGTGGSIDVGSRDDAGTSGESDTGSEPGTEADTEHSTDTQDSDNGPDTNIKIDTGADAETDTSVDTGDTGSSVETETSARGSLEL